MTGIRALLFDVFGTLVDWRTSVAREAEAVLAPLGHALDWPAFADDWRARYQPAMEAVRCGLEPYVALDELHRRNLDAVLASRGIKLDEARCRHLNLAWHRLDAWPDVGDGLAALRAPFLLAPCSNGNIALMVALARRNGWHWDAILGAEPARAYKPQPLVYLHAVAALGLTPAETLMVAAHAADLAAAGALGLRTAFLARAAEYGRPNPADQPDFPVDFHVDSLPALAAQLRAGG